MQKTFTSRLIIMLTMMLTSLAAAAFEVSIYLEHAEYVTLTTAAGTGRVLELATGRNTVDLTAEDSPLRIAPNPNCKITELVHDGGFTWPGTEAVDIPFTEGSSISVYSAGPPQDKDEVTVTFTGITRTFSALSGGKALDLGAFNKLKKNALISIKPEPGFRITGITTNPTVDVQGGGSDWAVVASTSMSINVQTAPDVEGNVVIDIDDPSNANVITATGRRLDLRPGENAMTLDPDTESPLTVTPTEGASILHVANPTVFEPDADGNYSVPLDPSQRLTHIYIVTLRDQSNNIVVNINNAKAVRLTDNYGREIPLRDGTNNINFDFNSDTLVHLECADDNTQLLSVAVDGIEEEIVDNRCDFHVYRNSVVDIAVSGAEIPEGWINLVDEDFSGFPEGTEDEPATDMPLLYENGKFREPNRFQPYNSECTNGWGGMNAFAAGGSLAVLNGFLDTPVGDFSGNLKMTFRARLVPGMPHDSQGLEVLLIRHTQLIDYKRQTYTLTDDWQTFTFEADNGWYYDTNIQFFTSDAVYFELDDVRIDHRIIGIEPPRATYPTEIYNDSFTANWETTATADRYLLSVYSHGESPETEVIDVDFESASTDADGHVTGLPDGWEFNLSANGDRCELNTDPEFASGTKSICLDASADYIQTPVSKYPISKISYKLAADNSGNGEMQTAAVLNVAALTDNGWSNWLTQSITYLAGQNAVIVSDITEYIKILDNIYAFRLQLEKTQADKVLVMVDDIHYEAPAPPENIYLWEDHEVPGQSASSCRVEDPAYDPEKDYYYSVKAANHRYVSAPSNEAEVFHAHQPVAYEPTDVTTSSFTASWDCGSKVDEYDVTLYRSVSVDTDTEDVVILDEDFGRIHSLGTAENPEQGEYTASPVEINDYTRIPGWSATSYSLMDGGIGGMEAKEGAQVGGIITPLMDLSHNGGVCKVRMRAWVTGGDALQVQATSPASYGALAWDATGWKELEFEIPGCGADDKITIWTGRGHPFMLDYVKVMQSLKAGEKGDIVSGLYRVHDPMMHWAEITDIDQYGDYELSYDVRSRRFHGGDPKDVYVSRRSNRVDVKLLPITDAVESVGENGALRVGVADGALVVATSEAGTLFVADAEGRRICARNVAAGDYRFEVSPGLYIVSFNGRSVKAIVK